MQFAKLGQYGFEITFSGSFTACSLTYILQPSDSYLSSFDYFNGLIPEYHQCKVQYSGLFPICQKLHWFPFGVIMRQKKKKKEIQQKKPFKNTQAKQHPTQQPKKATTKRPKTQHKLSYLSTEAPSLSSCSISSSKAALREQISPHLTPFSVP